MARDRTNATHAEFEQAPYGVEFPASRDAIVRAARDKGGLDAEVQFILERLPKSSYRSFQELEQDVLHTYQAEHGLSDGGSASPPQPQQRPDPCADPRRP